MLFRNIRPICVLWAENIKLEEMGGVLSGLKHVLSLAGVYNEIKVEHTRNWHQLDYRNPDGSLKPYQSLAWHIDQAKKNVKLPGHLNCSRLLDSIFAKPAYKTESGYKLIIVKEPLQHSDASKRKIGGTAQVDCGAIITLDGYLQYLQPIIGESDKDKKKRHDDYFLGTRNVLIHEVAHMCNVLIGPYTENPTDEDIIKAHCQNECVMNWKIAVWNKINTNPLCPSCLEKLKQHFIEP